MTTDGRKMDYNRLQNYIQSDMKLEDLKKMKIERQEKEEIPDEIKGLLATEDDGQDDYLIPEDNIYTGKGLGNINEPRHIAPAYAHAPASLGNINTPTNMNTAIIEKALKNTTKPQFYVNVSWTDYPERQIEMLKDVMDIPEDEILDWYLDNIDMVEIVDAVKEGIRNRILFKEEDIIDLGDIFEEATVTIPTVEDVNPTVTVEKPPVVKKEPASKKVTTTTKNAVKKPATKKAVKKTQPKES
jgi:hypothetical protein